MAKFNRKIFEKEIAKTLESQSIKQQARAIAQQKVRRAQREMLQEFNSHPVTREVEGGSEANNLSGTLGGYGNLFTFIGFNRSSRPTASIRKYLEREVNVFSQPRVIKTRNESTFLFRISSPKIEVLEELSPSPWEGRSWIKGVETGITGLGNYLYQRHEGFPTSRSGKAVQKTEQMRTMSFRPIRYMTSILEEFYKQTR